MNKKNKIIAENELLDTIKKSSQYATREGCIKCWKGTSFEHFMTLCAVAWKIVNSGWRVFTEVEFKNGGRADLVAISGETGFVVEILHSETEAKFSHKEDMYPESFEILKVNTKDFDIDKFDW